MYGSKRLLLVLHVLVSVCLLLGVNGQNSYYLSSEGLTSDDRLLPYVGNGHVATQVYRDTIYMNNVYNGRNSTSRRARIPSSAAVTIPGLTSAGTHTLDMYNGVFSSVFSEAGYTIQQNIYAHRSRTRLLITDMIVTRNTGTEGDITIALALNLGSDSSDFNATVAEYQPNSRYFSGCIVETETETSTRVCVHQFYQNIPPNLTLPAASIAGNWSFITSLSTDRADAEENFLTALQTDYSTLFSEHVGNWNALWAQSNITMNGDFNIWSVYNTAVYYLMSSMPLEEDLLNPFGGLSPGSLARGAYPDDPLLSLDYLGHIFWDQDTWMFPPILVMFPEAAKVMLTSRTRVLNATRDVAAGYGDAGTRFAWEQAYSGYDVCPWIPGSLYQLHITADVDYALRQYLYETADTDFVNNERGKEMAMSVATYWASKCVLLDQQKGYEILDAMGPDEYHYPINNSVYTNFIAKLSLELPAYLRDYLNTSFTADENEEVDSFVNIASDLFILFDDVVQYHPQYDGFNPQTETIKQADVVLLGFPLLMNMTEEVRRNDLEIYEPITDPAGPAMTWSMYSVAWLELGQPERAAELFYRQFDNVVPPFNVFTEVPAANNYGATNFITAAGGYLQSIIFGYGGVRLKPHQMDIHGHLLPNSTSWQLNGLQYRGFSVQLSFHSDTTTIRLLRDRQDGTPLIYYHVNGCARYVTSVDEDVVVPTGRGLLVLENEERLIDVCTPKAIII